MAQNVIINGVTYQSVPEVNIPKSGGGTAKFFDTASADVESGDLLVGKTAYGSSGVVSGSMPNNGLIGSKISKKSGRVVVPAGYTEGGIVYLESDAVKDLVAGNLLNGKTVLGVTGTLALPSISQDSTTKVLSIS